MTPKPLRATCVVAASGCSATLLLGVSGALILQGHDGLAAMLGMMGAVFLASVIVVPVLNATRSDDIVGALQARQANPMVTTLAQCILAICTLGLIAAELTAGGWLVARLSGLPFGLATAILAGVMGLVVIGSALGKLHLGHAAWVDGWIAAFIAVTLFILLAAIARPGMVPGSAVLMEPALGDIARLETQLLGKRLADPALLKPHAVPFLRTDVWNFLALITCLAGGLALLWPTRASTQTSRGARVGILATLAPVLLLAPFAAEAKRALLVAFDAGVRPSALPNWLETYQRLGAVQVCGSTSSDAAVVSKACGKGVGSQGFMRWHEAVFAPDALALAGLDSLALSGPLLWLLAVGVLLAVLVITLRLTGSATRSLGITGSGAGSAGGALVAVGGIVAWLQPTDSLTMVAWAASLALAGLGPVCLAVCVFGQVSGRAAAFAMLSGLALTVLLVLTPRYLPLSVADMTGALANAPPAIVRRIAMVRDSLATMPAGEAKVALALTAERLARDHIVWLSLKPIASGVWGFLLGAIVLSVGQLLARLLGRSQSHKV